ncbi:hypothetical protein LOTGIDRAFT_173664 [Lottia gigantea]|uniref:Uncharacterized protein n=1 Tax=Lottia gigantea TaxID=225164 RepID=V4CCH6_LOTGI|nr:hypothetical protein LOTGIDRAFT_173664 [Lottia gigantea]ESO99599.1 hypothetical protein LOTGIDRAFT_173664 [Lottia gigantea]
MASKGERITFREEEVSELLGIKPKAGSKEELNSWILDYATQQSKGTEESTFKLASATESKSEDVRILPHLPRLSFFSQKSHVSFDIWKFEVDYFQGQMFFIMQTVISWRRPLEGAALYPRTNNACSYLLGNTMCYVISGMMLLVVGVIITSMSFQNLEDYKDEERERYAGPVMIAAGVLVLARGAFSRLRPPRSELSRRRSFLRRYIRDIYSRPIFALRNSTSLSLCDIQISDVDDCSRRIL